MEKFQGVRSMPAQSKAQNFMTNEHKTMKTMITLVIRVEMFLNEQRSFVHIVNFILKWRYLTEELQLYILYHMQDLHVSLAFAIILFSFSFGIVAYSGCSHLTLSIAQKNILHRCAIAFVNDSRKSYKLSLTPNKIRILNQLNNNHLQQREQKIDNNDINYSRIYVTIISINIAMSYNHLPTDVTGSTTQMQLFRNQMLYLRGYSIELDSWLSIVFACVLVGQ